MGYFTHLLEGLNNSVPSVLSVPDPLKLNVSKGLDGTQNTILAKTQSVPSVPAGTLTGTPGTQAENEKMAESVPSNTIKNKGLYRNGTQEHVEHLKNSLSEIEQEPFEERAAIIEHEANIPREWAEAFARMDCMAKPAKLTPICWQVIVDATGMLLDSHLPALINNGWQVEDVFSCHATAPEHNYSVMGLVFLMAGKEITHIDAEAITLKTPGGAVQRYRKPQQDYYKVMVWELG